MAKWKVYLSSTYKDLKDARSILINLFQKQLQSKFELTTIMEWMYDDGSQTPFQEDCKRAVENSHIYILLLGNEVGSYPPNETRTYTEIELDTARNTDKKIFVLRLKDFDVKPEHQEKHDELLAKFKGKNIHVFEDETSLVKSLYDFLVPFASQSPIDFSNPYKGLNAFEINDGKYFCGRNTEVTEAIKKLVATDTPLCVIGNSGIGKTSFVQAGVMYQLLHNPTYKKYHNYRPIVVNPGSTPFTNLKFKADITYFDEFEALDQSILFLNQFEEVVTQCTSPEAIRERDLLFNFLDQLTAKKEIQCLIIMTFRSDFLSQLVNFDFVKKANVYALRSLSNLSSSKWEESIREIITQPAHLHGVSIEPELVNLLVEDMRNMDSSLPLLEFTLEKLWVEDTIKDGYITTREYNSITGLKGMGGVVATHAASVVTHITQGNALKEQIVKSIFVNLVAVNNAQSDIKRTVAKKSLFSKLSSYPTEQVQEIYEQLIGEECRLLVESIGKNEATYVDIVHEILIRKWESLRVWIDERRDALEYKNRLIEDCDAYNQKKLNVELYGRKQLKQYDEWLKANPDLLESEIEEFIQKSKTQLKRQYTIAAVVALLLLVGVPLGNYLYKRNLFNDTILPNTTFQQQLEAVGYKPNSLHKLTIDATNANLLKDFMRYNNVGSIDTLVLQDNIHELESIIHTLDNTQAIKVLQVVHNASIENLHFAEELPMLRSLSIEDCPNLGNLEGIAQLKQVETLVLRKNVSLTTIEGINPNSIKNLTIQDCENIEDIELLAQQTNLRSLRLKGDDIPDALSYLGENCKITQLYLEDNYTIESLDDLPVLNSVTSLTLSEISKLDNLNGLDKKFSHVKSLHLINNKYIQNIDALQSLSKLTSLYINGIKSNNQNKMSLIDVLNHLSNLDSLSIINCTITQVPLLNNHPKLRYLYVEDIDHDIYTSKEIGELPALQTLIIKNDASFDLIDIERFANLKRLFVRADKISNHENLRQLTQLEHLTLERADNIDDLRVISGLSNLTSLALIDSDMETLDGIASLKKLQVFTLEKNWFIENKEHLRPLSKLDKLVSLKLIDNLYLKSVDIVKSIKNLQHLTILGNNNLTKIKSQDLMNLPNLREVITDRPIDYREITKNNKNLRLHYKW